MTELFKQFKTAFILFIVLTIITGIIYPAVITLFSQTFFSWKANGSIIKQDNKPVGSFLIGQSFTDPQFFWGRPSATSPYPYNADNSSGSNLALSNPAYVTLIEHRVDKYKKYSDQAYIPVDLLTASGSGLDPDISPSAAIYQIPRVAKASGIPENTVRQLVLSFIQKRTFNVLGEPRVDVLALNLALNRLEKTDGNGKPKP